MVSGVYTRAPFLGDFPWKHICWFEHDGLLDILMENTWWTCWEPSSNGIKSTFPRFSMKKNGTFFHGKMSFPGWHSMSFVQVLRQCSRSGHPHWQWGVSAVAQVAQYPSGKRLHNYGKPPFLMGQSTISMAIFNSYVKLPEGNHQKPWATGIWWGFQHSKSNLTHRRQ